MNREIELFANVTDRSTHSVQPLNKIMEWATTNEILKAKTNAYRKWLKDNPNATKQEKSAKKVTNFPACTFAGTFTGTGKATDIKNMSGLIVLDIDHIENFEFVKMNLELDEYTYLLFTSPSNDGLKIVVKHTLTNPEEWKYLYSELEAYYKNNFNITTDKACKDISRMTFLPYINNLYRNDNCTEWKYKGIPQQTQQALNTIISHTATPNEESEDLYKYCFYLSAYLFENKIDITTEFSEWIMYGYSLCSLGEAGREIYNNISCVNPDYNPAETNKQYDYMIEHYDPTRTGIDYYISNAKTAIIEQLFKNKYGFIA